MEIKFSFNQDIHSFLTVPASEHTKNKHNWKQVLQKTESLHIWVSP